MHLVLKITIMAIRNNFKYYFFILLILPIFFSKLLLANVVYDKNNIIITNIELVKYKELFLEVKNEKLNDILVIKKIVLLKKTIKNLEKKQPKFVKKLDESIISQYGLNDYNDSTKRDFLRYFKIRNEFIIEYFNNDLSLEDIEEVINSFSNFKLPISDNSCQTIIGNENLKNNKYFAENLLENLKSNKKSFLVNIDGTILNVCMNNNNYKKIESQLIKNIEIKTENRFRRFIYGK